MIFAYDLGDLIDAQFRLIVDAPRAPATKFSMPMGCSPRLGGRRNTHFAFAPVLRSRILHPTPFQRFRLFPRVSSDTDDEPKSVQARGGYEMAG